MGLCGPGEEGRDWVPGWEYTPGLQTLRSDSHLPRDTEVEDRFLGEDDWGPRRTTEEIERLQIECQR